MPRVIADEEVEARTTRATATGAHKGPTSRGHLSFKHGSRIRTRLATEVSTRDESLACLDHLLTSAGNATLMTKELCHTLVDHAAGNYRIFIATAGGLLMSAAQREITTLDEKLYLQVFARPDTPATRRAAARS